MQLKKDKHCVSMLGLHLVWCTKYRKPVLIGSVEVVVRQTIAQACVHNKWDCLSIEIMPDYVHLFVQINYTDTPSTVVKTLKSVSAVAAFYSHPSLKQQKFWGTGLWSRGSYYGSVGQVSQETILKYIEEQKTK